ncbi:putative membrane protein [Sphaerisporangium rubeum]|uniref:Putative membrane protein n=2 Tax=Sphaerisporangium rubeum TaxID=321317 RepID=A0A7X0IDJ4_9ACTN|nr:putative membrane protein [Sphaerisporangium rubeum]
MTIMWWDHDGMGGWGYALMTLGMVVFWGLVAATIVLAIRYAGKTTRTDRIPSQQSAEEVLARRFARGEIDAEEYHARLDTLRERHDSPLGG